jgi:hypothetical protein
MSGNSAILGLQPKTLTINAIAAASARDKYGWVRGLSTTPSCQEIHHFDRLFTLPSRYDWASVRPAQTSPKDFT